MSTSTKANSSSWTSNPLSPQSESIRVPVCVSTIPATTAIPPSAMPKFACRVSILDANNVFDIHPRRSRPRPPTPPLPLRKSQSRTPSVPAMSARPALRLALKNVPTATIRSARSVSSKPSLSSLPPPLPPLLNRKRNQHLQKQSKRERRLPLPLPANTLYDMFNLLYSTRNHDTHSTLSIFIKQ